jgi:hypothetical protein
MEICSEFSGQGEQQNKHKQNSISDLKNHKQNQKTHLLKL